MIDLTLQVLRENRVLRFFVAGAVNTLFGFVVYSAAILLGARLSLALLLGLVCGTIFNFFSTGGYVFRDLKLARVPRFLVCYALVYTSNLKLIEWLAPWVGNAIAAQAILTIPIALLTYLLMSRFVFAGARSPAAKQG
jgi:putative flippase GtrA